MSRVARWLAPLALITATAVWLSGNRTSVGAPLASAASDRAHASVPPSLELRELFEAGSELKLSSKARALAGQRVRLVGFVAEQELRPAGAVYLVPQPVHCDEAGGGSADLPPESVLVALPAGWQPPAHVAGPVEAIGRLDVGNGADALGRVANFRLQLEAPWEAPAGRSSSGARR